MVTVKNIRIINANIAFDSAAQMEELRQSLIAKFGTNDVVFMYESKKE
jgi:hypothetical protein